MKPRIHSSSIEEVEDAFLVGNKGQEIGYFNSYHHAVAFAIIYALGKKRMSQQEQLELVASALEVLLQSQQSKSNRNSKHHRKLTT